MLEILNKITGILEWSEIAGIIAVMTVLTAVLFKIAEAANLIFERYLRGSRHPIIEIPLVVDKEDDVDFIVQTFRLNPNRKLNHFEEYWKEDQKNYYHSRTRYLYY